MSDLRKFAKGQICMIRLPGICNFNPETTVLAHYRLSNISGMGMKVPDLLASFACSACHAACDSQTKSKLTREERQLALAEGVLRTQAYLIGKGKIKW